MVVAGLLFAVVGAIAVTETRLGDGHGVALAAVLLLAAWSTALLIDAAVRPTTVPATTDRRRPTVPVPAIALSVLTWWVITLLLEGAWLRLDAPVDLFGTFERLLLSPTLALAMLAVARRLRLHRGVTAFFIFITVLGLFRSPVQEEWPTEFVAAAGPEQLATALRDGNPIALASTRQDRGTPVAPIPTKPGMRCQRIELRDERRTLIGASAGRTEITTDTCWNADGTPFAVRVIASTDAGETEAAPQTVQVLGADPFEISYGSTEPISDGSDGEPATGARGPYGLRPFAPDGRVRLSGGERSVLARVGRRGREVQLVLGWLRADPLRQSTSAETASNIRVVNLARTPGRNEALDVFTVTGAFAGGPDAQFVRRTRDGQRPLAQMASSTGMRPVATGERERVVLRGGR